MRRKYFALTTILAIFSFAQISYANCIEKDDLPVCVYSNDTEKDCNNKLAKGAISAAYNRLSEPVQKLFCTVKEVQVHENLNSWSLAEYDWANETIYIDQSIILNPFSLDTYYLIADEMNFERNDARAVYTWSNDIAAEDFAYSNDSGIYFLIVHELGHHLENIGVIGNPFHCVANNQTPRSKKIVEISNNCVGKVCDPVPASNAREFYSWLNNSSFVSIYSIYSPKEDFAETFMSYEIEVEMGIHHSIDQNSIPIFSTNSSSYKSAKEKKFDIVKEYLDKFGSGEYPHLNELHCPK